MKNFDYSSISLKCWEGDANTFDCRNHILLIKPKPMDLEVFQWTSYKSENLLSGSTNFNRCSTQDPALWSLQLQGLQFQGKQHEERCQN